MRYLQDPDNPGLVCSFRVIMIIERKSTMFTMRVYEKNIVVGSPNYLPTETELLTWPRRSQSSQNTQLS